MNEVIVTASELFGFEGAVEKAIRRGQHAERNMTPEEYRAWLGAVEVWAWVDPDDPDEIIVTYRDPGAVDFQEEGSVLWWELGADWDIFPDALADALDE